MFSLFTSMGFGAVGLPFLLVGGSLLIIMLAQIVLGVRDLLLGRASASWTPVAGIVVESGVVRQSNRKAYRAAIAYTYSVGDRTYRGRRRHFGSEYAVTQGGAEAIAGRYAAGTPVQVYHHPTRHGLAVLEPGVVLTDALMRLGQGALGLVVIVPFLRLAMPAIRFYLAQGGH